MIAFYLCDGCEQVEMEVKTVECTLNIRLGYLCAAFVSLVTVIHLSEMFISKLSASATWDKVFLIIMNLFLYENVCCGYTLRRYKALLINKEMRKIFIKICLLSRAMTKQFPLRKHAYSNIYKISHPKPENFRMKNSNTLFIFLL